MKRHSPEHELERFRATLVINVDGVPFRVREVLACIHEHLFERDLTVARVRAQCRLRDHNVSCQFHNAIGMPMREYIERLRLAAADRLMDAGASVADAAYLVGYAHLQTFYRAFARYSHHSPGSGGRAMTQPDALPTSVRLLGSSKNSRWIRA